MGKIQQNSTFKASPKQLQFAEIWLDYTKKQTFEDIAKVIGVERTTIWYWFQKPDFVNWINSKKDELLKNSLMPRYRTAIRKAEAGNFNFSKLLFEMTGDYTQKSETKIIRTDDGLDNLTMEELIKEFERDINIYRNRIKSDGSNSKKDKER